MSFQIACNKCLSPAPALACLHTGGTRPFQSDPYVQTICHNVLEQCITWNVSQERVRGQEYDELIDELIEALRERYGASFILHWEDFNVRNSFRLLDKYVAQVRCL